LVEHREVPTARGLQFARDHGMNFMETSALSGSNVDRAFKILLTDIHKLTFKDLQTGGTTQVTGGVVLSGSQQGGNTDTCCEGSFDSWKNIASSWFS